MRGFRKSMIPVILATIAVGTATLTLSPQKRVVTQDTEIRLMAMLYVAAVTPD